MECAAVFYQIPPCERDLLQSVLKATLSKVLKQETKVYLSTAVNFLSLLSLDIVETVG